MGCPFDSFEVRLKEEKYIKPFVDMFNKKTENDVADWFRIYVENFKETEEGYVLSVDEDALFVPFEVSDILEKAFVAFLTEFPDAEFSASQERGWNNCGDTLLATFTYDTKDKVLDVEMRVSDEPYVSFCDECGWEVGDDCDEDDEDFPEWYVHLKDYVPGQKIICPSCGEEIPFDASVSKIGIKIV